MVRFVFTKFGQKQFEKLDAGIRDRLIQKLREIKTHPDIFSILKPLYDFSPATHRLRIGAYRLILQQKTAEEFLVLDVGHRRDVYR